MTTTDVHPTPPVAPDPDGTTPAAASPREAESRRGRNAYSEKAVTKLVTAAIRSVPGTASLESTFARSYPRVDVQIDDEYDTVACDIIMAATWPSPVASVAETVRTTVEAWIRRLTGMRPVRINVAVGPVEAGPAVSEATLAAFDPQPTPVPVVATRLPVADVVTQPPLRLTPVTVARTVDVQSVNRAPAMELVPVDRGPQVAVTSPQIAPRQPVRRVDVTPNRFHDTPVVTAPALPLAPVKVFPLAGQASRIRVAAPRTLTRIVTTTPQVASITPPAPIQPVPVTVAPPVPTITPRVAQHTPLLEVQVARRPLVPVTVRRRGTKAVSIAQPVPTTPVTIRPSVGALRRPVARQRTIIIPTAPRARAARLAEGGDL
ncbi:hypothetical protein C1Y63_08725 [Corynebacterium sp. 13CS0277]|uniref:Asp23/Gls24 family envelope stress response protein n=1 Tax=Corynebacterium sp. 13CS0277 TaxID=2071994 RepID=UPI000D02ADE5|nr:Asp23/Gls24 family envelope stress response protein [Corynebacterium sp. 13CS0277]PRQ10938.1 hypothetical protein C1Y63_08725 [Corynebacterium sp. 13CS0277]